MDLSRPFLPDRALDGSPADLAVLLATAGVAQGASATAQAQASLDAGNGAEAAIASRPEPASGSFDAAVAAALRRWESEARWE